jgi:hypothetical protein
MISKELLSEVFNKKVSEISTPERDARERGYLHISGIFIIFEDNRDVIISIYELAHKCKEWLKSKGYMTVVYIHLDTVAVNICLDSKAVYWTPAMTVLTEPEAIFLACQWVLENN